MAPHNGRLDDDPHRDAYLRAIEHEYHHHFCDNNHTDTLNQYSDTETVLMVQQIGNDARS